MTHLFPFDSFLKASFKNKFILKYFSDNKRNIYALSGFWKKQGSIKIATKDSMSLLHTLDTVGIFFCPTVYTILRCLKIYSLCVYINLHLAFLHYKHFRTLLKKIFINTYVCTKICLTLPLLSNVCVASFLYSYNKC